MKFTLNQIAAMLGGTVEGNPEAQVWQLCKIEEGQEGGLSFLTNTKYTNYIYDTKATAVIVSNDFVGEHPISASLVRVAEPYLAFATLLKKYNEISGYGMIIPSLRAPGSMMKVDASKSWGILGKVLRYMA